MWWEAGCSVTSLLQLRTYVLPFQLKANSSHTRALFFKKATDNVNSLSDEDDWWSAGRNWKQPWKSCEEGTEMRSATFQKLSQVKFQFKQANKTRPPLSGILTVNSRSLCVPSLCRRGPLARGTALSSWLAKTASRGGGPGSETSATTEVPNTMDTAVCPSAQHNWRG